MRKRQWPWYLLQGGIIGPVIWYAFSNNQPGSEYVIAGYCFVAWFLTVLISSFIDVSPEIKARGWGFKGLRLFPTRLPAAPSASIRQHDEPKRGEISLPPARRREITQETGRLRIS